MNKPTIYALGFFDGVHLGHQALLTACRELADRHGCAAGAVTFTAHPDGTVSGNAPALLTTTEDRRKLLYAYGMEQVVELPFDRALMTMHWRDFIRMLQGAPYRAEGFVCGNDFRFGHKGEGTAEILKQYCRAEGMPYAIVPEQILDGQRISSTHIRSLLAEGNAEKARRFLGYPYTLSGKVVSGKQLGRTIGVPTANVLLPEGLLAPRFGVYACKVTVDGEVYPAVTNIGIRPTVSGEGVTVEVHLLDFAGNLYGRELSVAFYKFLRPEQKFANLDALKMQITEDITQVRTIFK